MPNFKVSYPSKTGTLEIFNAADAYEAKTRAAVVWGMPGPLTAKGDKMIAVELPVAAPPPFVLSDDEERQVKAMMAAYPFRLVYAARNLTTGEFVTSAVPTKRIPNRLVREGWQVSMCSKA